MKRPLLVSIAAIVFLALLGMAFGDHEAGVGDLLRWWWHPDAVDPMTLTVLVDFRLPRIALAGLVGASLALAGAITQAVMRNPLAEPGILGLNSGAALAAMVAIVMIGGNSSFYLSWAGTAGALAMVGLVYAIAWRDGISTTQLILVGIGLSTLAGAFITVISIIGNVRDVQRALIWLNGSLYDATWAKVYGLAVWMILPVGLAMLLSRELDLLRYGEDTARSLGQKAHIVRSGLIILCAMLSGAAISATGIVGFVGLIGPHLARATVGHGHARLLPVAALFGAVLVMAADFIGRTIIAPAQIPAGLMTAILGTPYFAYLLWKGRNAVV